MNQPVKKEKPPADGVFSFILKSGEWRTMFDELRYKTLVAEALNATICEREFRGAVVGYHIRDWCTYIVLVIDQKKIQKMFHFFFDRVREGIRHQLDLKEKQNVKEYSDSERIRRRGLFEHLFEELPLRDEQYTRLITGRKVELPYYDPDLEYLKSTIHNDPFCSALDYEGGRSPVLVRVLSKHDWKQLERSAQ
jgi:hypothetical protein